MEVCKKLPERSLPELLGFLPRLEKLEITAKLGGKARAVAGLSNEGEIIRFLESLSQNSPHLACLVLQLGRAFTDACLLACITPRLRRLDISGCASVTDAGVVGFVSASLPVLTSLRLDSTRITGASLLAVAECCPLLQELSVARCPGLTTIYTGYLDVVRQCRQLRTFNYQAELSTDDLRPYLSALCHHHEEITEFVLNCRLEYHALAAELSGFFTQFCPRLVVLELRCVSGYLPDELLDTIAGACTRLERLCLSEGFSRRSIDVKFRRRFVKDLCERNPCLSDLSLLFHRDISAR